MRVNELRKLLDDVDSDLEIMTTDGSSSNIIQQITGIKIVEVEEDKEYAWSERHCWNFPIGHKFLKLY